MITNHDRSRWFGASDTAVIMGNWGTKTFAKWWLVKLGIAQQTYHSRAMDVGNIMEHAIIDKVSELTGRRIRKGRRPLYSPLLRLRVNYDGLCRDCVVEIKTAKAMFATVPKNYWQQCQVLMYRTRRTRCELWAYEVTEDDYAAPYFARIAPSRLRRFSIGYDPEWVENVYLPRLRVLARALRGREFPHENPG